MNQLQQARDWIVKQEEDRLTTDNIDRPNTKWVFVRFIKVQLSIVQTREALLSTESLPEWLRQKKGVVALDTWNDNLCLFRCLALPRGASRSQHHQSQRARHSFYNEQCLYTQDQSRQSRPNRKTFQVGCIRVYQPTEHVWHLTRQPAHYPDTMTIGMLEQHAFYIKDVKKVASSMCGYCSHSFTTSSDLQRHADRCTQGVTKIICSRDKVDKPQSFYEKAFCPEQIASKIATRRLEYQSQQRSVHTPNAVTVASAGSQALPSMGWPVEPYFNSTATVGTDAPNINPTKGCTNRQSRETKQSEKPDLNSWSFGFECEMPKPPNISRFQNQKIKPIHTPSCTTSKPMPTRDRPAHSQRHYISVFIRDILQPSTHLCNADPKQLTRCRLCRRAPETSRTDKKTRSSTTSPRPRTSAHQTKESNPRVVRPSPSARVQLWKIRYEPHTRALCE